MVTEAKPPLDLPELQELYGDELLLALLREFRSSTPGMLEEVRSAVGANHSDALFQAAHRLKSAVSNLYSDGAREAAARLEHMGRFAELGEATASLHVLEGELERLLTAVDEAIAAS